MSRGKDFYDWPGPRRTVTAGAFSGALPVFYHDNDAFLSLHTASYEAVAGALPSDLIRPVQWVDGRAVLVVMAFRYHAATWRGSDGATGTLTPYGEVGVAAVVSLGRAPRVLPLFRRELSAFVLHLPVTTLEAREGGMHLWGFPKFVADMQFTEAPTYRRVRVAEGDKTIVTLTVRPRGPVLVDRAPLISYSSLDGQLLETVIPVLGHRQVRFGRRAGELILGDHGVADQLRSLEMSPSPLAVMSYLDLRLVLPAGRPVGAARAYRGYAGADQAFARYTVQYPGAPTIDEYAGVTTRVSAIAG